MSSTDLVVPETLEALTKLDLTTLKAQEIGLNLLLLKLAQKESQRISKLSAIIDLLEDAIFDPSIIEHLTPSEQIVRYQLATQATQNASTYISSAIKNVNWNDIETKILILDQEGLTTTSGEKTEQTDIQEAALRLLQQLSVAPKK